MPRNHYLNNGPISKVVTLCFDSRALAHAPTECNGDGDLRHHEKVTGLSHGQDVVMYVWKRIVVRTVIKAVCIASVVD